jgi:hypothetical protein
MVDDPHVAVVGFASVAVIGDARVALGLRGAVIASVGARRGVTVDGGGGGERSGDDAHGVSPSEPMKLQVAGQRATSRSRSTSRDHPHAAAAWRCDFCMSDERSRGRVGLHGTQRARNESSRERAELARMSNESNEPVSKLAAIAAG